ncbi:MAG: hypothetical protein JWP36_2315 [Paucimonas sp.]|nr:hypothetical protein [Paucimonas sp.]
MPLDLIKLLTPVAPKVSIQQKQVKAAAKGKEPTLTTREKKYLKRQELVEIHERLDGMLGNIAKLSGELSDNVRELSYQFTDVAARDELQKCTKGLDKCVIETLESLARGYPDVVTRLRQGANILRKTIATEIELGNSGGHVRPQFAETVALVRRTREQVACIATEPAFRVRRTKDQTPKALSERPQPRPDRRARDEVRDEVREEVPEEVRGEVPEEVRDEVPEEVRHEVPGNVRDEAPGEVDEPVWVPDAYEGPGPAPEAVAGHGPEVELPDSQVAGDEAGPVPTPSLAEVQTRCDAVATAANGNGDHEVRGLAMKLKSQSEAVANLPEADLRQQATSSLAKQLSLIELRASICDLTEKPALNFADELAGDILHHVSEGLGAAPQPNADPELAAKISRIQAFSAERGSDSWVVDLQLQRTYEAMAIFDGFLLKNASGSAGDFTQTRVKCVRAHLKTLNDLLTRAEDAGVPRASLLSPLRIPSESQLDTDRSDENLQRLERRTAAIWQQILEKSNALVQRALKDQVSHLKSKLEEGFQAHGSDVTAASAVAAALTELEQQVPELNTVKELTNGVREMLAGTVSTEQYKLDVLLGAN